MRLRNRRYSWLEPDKKLKIENLSQDMRSNYISVEFDEPLKFKDENPTSVEWCTKQLKDNKPC